MISVNQGCLRADAESRFCGSGERYSMNVIKYDLFPGANHRCITMSYDDGRDFDIRLAQIFRENGLKGTFHLNSARFDKPGVVKTEELKEIYAGHEVSCHMVTHPFPTDNPDISVLEEIIEDRKVIEAACGYVVRGMSYPYGNYDQRVIDLCRAAGMEYSRTTKATNNFALPEDFLAWHPTCHHKHNVMEKLEAFYAPTRYNRLQLLYVWGHSYEFNNDNNWELIEEFAKAAGNREDTWYATNIEIVDYVNALRALRVSADRTMVYNPSAIEVWFTINGQAASVKPGQTFVL